MDTNAGLNGTLDWDAALGCLTVAVRGEGFNKVLPVVRGLPDRQFDNVRKLWTLPAAQADIILEILQPLGVGISPGLAAWLSTRKAPPRPARENNVSPASSGPGDTLQAVPQTGPPPEQASGDLSVAEVLRRMQAAVAAAFGNRAHWVTASLREWREQPRTGHIFIKLVDDPTASGGDEISAVIWSGKTAAIRKAYSDKDIVLARDDRVRLRCRFEFRRGQLQLVVEEVDPSVTEAGDRVREMRLRVLEERGLATRNKVLRMPPLPLVVGIVSARGAYGYEDFTKVLRDSGLPFTLILHPSSVQGAGAEAEVPAAIRSLGLAGVDVVAVIRGGGSAHHLACFNALSVGEAIARCPVPVVTGIGHEPDLHLADLVAARPCKTPTDAANHLVQQVLGARDAVLRRAANRLVLAREIAQRHQARLVQTRQRLGFVLDRVLRDRRRGLERLHPAAGVRRGLDQERQRLDSLAARWRSADPDRPLRLGYARLVATDGRAIRHIDQLAADQALVLHLADGQADAVVTRTRPDGDRP
ncbi:MAG: exodeoxyribonuclease VII large subunit [Candidatus Sericytochromatia bacterium]|nr:exodeoxyribonuclease VII large subunit [Candidatus Tanganyikabacteria bacterium]